MVTQSGVFPAFCLALTSNTALQAMVDNQIVPGHQTPLLTYFLGKADQALNKSCILIESTTEKDGIDGEGYTAEFKQKIAFTYTVVIASRNGNNATYIDSIIQAVKDILGTEITQTGYRLFFESIEGDCYFRLDPEMKLESGFWQVNLVCNGYTWLNYKPW
jgi:hypothetical protein